MAMPPVDQGTFPTSDQRVYRQCTLDGETFHYSVLTSDSHTLIPPLGYKIAGISGSFGSWVDGFSLIIQH